MVTWVNIGVGTKKAGMVEIIKIMGRDKGRWDRVLVLKYFSSLPRELRGYSNVIGKKGEGGNKIE